MGVALHTTTGPAVEHKGALAGLLTKLEPNDVLFIDEIHRLTPTVEESLYPAIEDFQIDIMTGDGPYAATYELPIPAVHAGRRDDAHRPAHGAAALALRLHHAARFLSRRGPREDHPPQRAHARRRRSTTRGAAELAQRSRGTPRVANRLLRRARDFAEVEGTGTIDLGDRAAHERAARDRRAGLDEMDRRLLRMIIDTYEGGPVGVETLAAALSEPRDTIEDVYEPYLLQIGMLGRTPRGRVATKKAYLHLGREPHDTGGNGAKDSQGSLF